MKLTDWRGNDYGVGATVIYPRQSGRSVEVKEAVVLDIYEVYRDPEDWSWKRLPEGELMPDDRPVELRVRVQPFKASRFTPWAGDEDFKPATLINVENITVLENRGS